jgi:hypothetical protein
MRDASHCHWSTPCADIAIRWIGKAASALSKPLALVLYITMLEGAALNILTLGYTT